MQKLPLLFLLLILFLCAYSCTEAPKDPSLKLFVLDGGRIHVLNALPFAETDVYAGESFVFSNPIFLVEHSKGRLIWDLGLPEGIADMPEGMHSPDSIFHMTLEAKLPEQLQALGLSPDSVDYIAFSHCHFDHTGGANHFKSATWLIQENEYAFATSDTAGQQPGYAPDTYSELTQGKIQKLQGAYDVFGDGTVKVIPTPGHTIGHQSLYLQLADHGPVVLSGDLCHTHMNCTEGRVPRFNFDIGQTKESMANLEGFLAESGAQLIIQHEMQDYEGLPKAPDYLD